MSLTFTLTCGQMFLTLVQRKPLKPFHTKHGFSSQKCMETTVEHLCRGKTIFRPRCRLLWPRQNKKLALPCDLHNIKNEFAIPEFAKEGEYFRISIFPNNTKTPQQPQQPSQGKYMTLIVSQQLEYIQDGNVADIHLITLYVGHRKGLLMEHVTVDNWHWTRCAWLSCVFASQNSLGVRTSNYFCSQYQTIAVVLQCELLSNLTFTYMNCFPAEFMSAGQKSKHFLTSWDVKTLIGPQGLAALKNNEGKIWNVLV